MREEERCREADRESRRMEEEAGRHLFFAKHQPELRPSFLYLLGILTQLSRTSPTSSLILFLPTDLLPPRQHFNLPPRPTSLPRPPRPSTSSLQPPPTQQGKIPLSLPRRHPSEWSRAILLSFPDSIRGCFLPPPPPRLSRLRPLLILTSPALLRPAEKKRLPYPPHQELPRL